LIDELIGYLWEPDHLYEHHWRDGDLVIWDNVALVHGRDDTSAGGARTLQRASVGAHHFFDLYPEFPPVRMPHEAAAEAP
jgi:taurine dioxygenase